MKRLNLLRLALIAFLITINLFSVAHAEIRTYEGVGEYRMTNEIVGLAKNKAELRAQRDILEQIKFYVKVNSKVVNSELISDEIITIAAGILHVLSTKYSITPEDDRILIKSFVTAQIDTDELEKLLEQEIKNRT